MYFRDALGAISGAGSRSNLTGLFNEEPDRPDQRPMGSHGATSRESPGGTRMSPIVEKFK